MKQQREIHGFDYAIVEFLSAIDRLFCGFIDGWLQQKIAGGLNILVEDEGIPNLTQCRVRIRPVSWSEENTAISLRINWGSCNNWEIFEGSVHAPHLFSNGMISFNFTCKLNRAGNDYAFRGRDWNSEDLLKRALTAQPMKSATIEKILLTKKKTNTIGESAMIDIEPIR